MCAADAEDDRNIITTVTRHWVPEFPRIYGQEIVTYEDGLWGPQEYTRWPQLFSERCIHHACIPLRMSSYSPGLQVYEGFGFMAWEQSMTSGVSGFGFLRQSLLKELYETACRVLVKYDEAERTARKNDNFAPGATSGVDRRLGRMLSLLLRNAIDRLRLVPTTEQHALVAGQMANRLILELSGLTVYYSVVVPRIASTRSYDHSVLDVLGAFVRNAATAQLCYRIGLPYWYIQPWSPDITIHRVVTPRLWSSELSKQAAYPRIPKAWYDPDGTHQDPGRWTHPSVVFVCNSLCSSALPRLQPVVRPEGAENETKRFKGTDASTSLVPAPKQTTQHTRNSKKRGNRSRGHRAGAKSHETHPATTYESPPDDLVAVAPNWHAALAKASPQPHPPPTASLYYFPPPFLIANAKTNQARYIHNFARIRHFCKLRLVDASINGAPLRISEWRHAVYGDYRLEEGVDDVSSSREPGEVVSKEPTIHQQRRDAVRGLFGKCGGLSSYQDTEVYPYRGTEVTLQVATVDKHVHAMVLWELYETNWRCELRALDALVVDHNTDAFRKWEREQLVTEVWRTSDLQTAFSALDISSRTFSWTPAGEKGWERRRDNLWAFLNVLRAWPACPEALRVNTEDIRKCDDVVTFNTVESCALRFYVDTFITKFHRLPCPPVHLVHRVA
ncbi:uncharacterized protein C8Q71DRAFT_863184 [Rhodofomes roseus]|uniref:Uncharacterized protein n=1 Tax=Rhodofomes roseus TaxID=34475 RepID=A0ABQ8JZS8_9APHY|nr:uncharacterized protein C8Q71DRAFT_863184 [Rhodofomes roseus]KAH9829609.1 hypothetical protein C8Q71DRAFT_863184 [Rhodofomes roseus]